MFCLKTSINQLISSGAIWFFLLIIFNAFLKLSAVNNSIIWGDKQLIPPRLIPENAISPKRYSVRQKILLYHNFFRSKVKPTAANMLLMSWHRGAAAKAQAYADQCKFLKHNKAEENALSDLGHCGQNLFVAAQKTPWFFGIRSWFVEYENFTYGFPVIDLKSVGHYTQMVWATSSKIGCGVAKCKGGLWGTFYNYVCHYCPAGNFDGIIHYPYKAGRTCSDCEDHCVVGLCSNPCILQNKYSNCEELVEVGSDACEKGICNATCFCGNRLYKNYPWK